MKELKRNEAITLCSPHSYTLATTIDKNGKPNIIGLSWWTFVSWEPFMIAISVGHPRYSHECLDHNPEFVLCFPLDTMAKDAWFCNTKSGRNVDKFAETNFTPVDSQKVKPPTIKESTVAFECSVIQKIPAGDHTVFLANVLNMSGQPDKPCHLYLIHYNKLVCMDYTGNTNFEMEY